MQLLGINKAEKFFLTFLGVLALIAIIVPFTSFTNPKKQLGIKLDQQRISQFSSLYGFIQSYYKSNASLPSDLSFVTTEAIVRDPETQAPIDYEIVSQTSFKLCTTFSTDSTDATYKNYRDVMPIYNEGTTNYNHKKGYDCILFRVTFVPTPTDYQIYNEGTDEDVIPQ